MPPGGLPTRPGLAPFGLVEPLAEDLSVLIVSLEFGW